MDPGTAAYFDGIETELESAFALAERARERGIDPEPDVEIPVAKDMADRVQNLLGIDGVADRIRELEAEMSREEAALALAEDFADGRVGDADDPGETIEAAVRTSVALLTEGVVAAPIEGIDAVEIESNDDGTEFVRVQYAGPIRSAGGTAQALSVLVADYARTLLGVEPYKPRDEEIERFAEEVGLYDDETGLQYSPSDEETRFIASNCPICLDGEPTSDAEVSGYRDLDRVDTNRARGGMCLVLAEGIALKAPKIQRYIRQLDEVDWPWLQDIVAGTVGGGDEPAEPEPVPDSESAVDESKEDETLAIPDPSDGYLTDLIAGRPVFSHPSREGGFRLRYGRARNHGHATAGIHPAAMHLFDDFLAPGTQIKTERPGKAAGVVPVDTIEGPTVRLATGEVRRLSSVEEAIEVRNGVDVILDVGEYLVNAGEFVENNYDLAPAAYAVEWWEQELEAAGADVTALRDDPAVDLERPTVARALEWAREYEAPLHPRFTYLWHDLDSETVAALASAVADASIDEDNRLLLSRSETVVQALETLLVPHRRDENHVQIERWRPLTRSLGVTDVEAGELRVDPAVAIEASDGLAAINELAPFSLRAKGPTRIGNRMGRPEKSERRDLSPPVHTLFPIGNAGGDQRNVSDATRHAETMQDRPGEMTVELGERYCAPCDRTTFRPRCEACGTRTTLHWECRDCGTVLEDPVDDEPACPRCERTVTPVAEQVVDLDALYHEALDGVGERETSFSILKGVKGLMSANKTPEPIEKGILRAKHDVSVFKDGTVRYDMTDLPVTAVRPEEVGVDSDTFRELGYHEDIHGDPLSHDDQLVELRVQDIIVAPDALDHLHRTANFVDDLLETVYDLEPYYELDDPEDLVGELVFGMAPHTSAAVVGRIVGSTEASVGYAHPYFHAAKRRNCFHPETEIRRVAADGTEVFEAIDSFVERLLTDPVTDDVGTRVQELEKPVRVQSIDESGRTVTREVTAVSKHPAPAHLVVITTESGRTVRVTADHPMLVWEDGLERRSASEMEAEDLVPIRAPDDSGGTAASASALADGGPVGLDPIESVRIEPSSVPATYCLTVDGTHTVFANGIATGQCDGDEDCVMLLMDGLLNFSRSFLPDRRGGWMDAPLVMSSRIDPSEIDDEAHNIDVTDRYGLEFYEATLRGADPAELGLALAEDSVGTEDEYTGFAHTHDTSDIAAGPELSAYKTLESMTEKMDAQLELARTLRAVDETDVAERVIESHFLPDLIGNLRAFTSQEVRCLECGTKFRRPPLTRSCRHCGGDVTLTVHEGSVDKYLGTALRIAEQYGCREYTAQRLRILERSIESLFEDDRNKQAGIADFM